MHVLSVLLRIVILLFIFCGTHGKVTVENGAYKDILVRFSPRVNSEDGGMLLKKMKEVLIETSEILGKAVRLKISSVIFLLPRSWDISKLENLTVEKATPENTVFPPDILVDNVSNSAFGNYPFALQYGGCMVPGRQISIQESFLTNEEDFPKGKLLAREWLKFYFGVFDENGFPDDTKYPLYYKVPGKSSSDIIITDCTHPAAEYYFKKGEENCTLEVNDQNGLPISNSSECEIRVTEDSRNKVHSSLMYYHKDLTQVDLMCGDRDHLHNSDAPNKHNTLCNGKSITEVVRSSGIDLTGESTGEISFSYVQEKDPSLAIAWQDTYMLFNQTEIVKNSVKRFLYDVPEESKVALYQFADSVDTVKDLNYNKRWPDFDFTFVSIEKPCVTCAISNAVNVLKEDDSVTRGYVIIIAAANPDASNSDYAEVVQQINSSQLCLIVIGFTNLGATSEEFQELVSASRCGSFWGVSTEEKDDEIFAKLYSAMETVLPSHDTNYITKIIDTQHVKYGKLLPIKKDERASKFTLRVGRVFDLSKYFSCIKTNGKESVKLTKEDAFSFSFPSQEDDVECSLTIDKLGSIYIQVQMTTKPNHYFEKHTWVKDTTSLASNSQASLDLSNQAQMPVIIYAQINYGGQPVQKAIVKAKVTGPNGKGEWNLDLLDDGLGDPDITAYDGIYSRYFINFTDKGEYTVVITASDNNLQAKIGQNGNQPCCGSKVVSETFPIGVFEESIKTTFSTISGKPEGGYKPSRIFDLHIISYDIPSKVSLQWTAPGAEADTGQVIKYVLRAFTSRNEAVNFIENNSIALDVDLQPKLRGTIEKTEIEINNAFNENTVYYIAMRSLNSKNQSSETSNIVKLFMPELFGSTTLSYEITTTRDTAKKSEINKVIGIVIGVVVLVLVLIICIYLAIYFCVLKPKRKEEEMEKERKRKNQQLTNQNSKEDSQTENHVLNPLNSIPADVLVKHHNEVVNAKIENKNPPIFDENKVNSTQSGPVYENKASSYELKLCFKQEDCSGNNSFSSWVKKKSIPKPEVHGIKQNATIVFDVTAPKNQTVHIGIQSKNENGKVSELSNLVALSLMYISPDEMTTIEIPREEEGKSTKNSEIGIIVGSTVIAIFLLIALTAIIYFYVYNPRRQKQTVAGKQNSTIIENNSIQKLESSTQPNNYGNSMRKVESFPVLLYTHDQIKDHRSKKKEASLYTSNIATKPWMSLDPLPNKSQAHLETRSLGSQSTLDVEAEKNSELPEIQQLHDTSQESVLETGNISKF